jgi:hypothetical protein
VLIFTDHVNTPGPVWKEVERAAHHLKAIMPFRVEDVAPKDALEFHLSTVHWLDAITPPLEQHFGELVSEVLHLLGKEPSKVGSAEATELPSVRLAASMEVFPLGETKIGELGRKGTLLYFAVPLESGDSIVARVTALGGIAMRPIPWLPRLEIRDPRGTLMHEQKNYPRCQLVAERVRSAGHYSVGFEDSGSGWAGSYSAFVQRVNRPERAKPLRIGESARGFIKYPGETATHTFEATAGDQVLLQVEQHTPQGIGPHVEVYDSRGELFEMAESFDYSGKEVAKPVQFDMAIDRGGTHTILISSFTPEGKGGYRVSLQSK